ncbi:hypothetical protein CDD80_2024 [Ophiocordyceps camponoti-rufipedis]|uniref:Uncharacterized protein n=1 Tax=Ophiocordyceps camponoti-rufipedis TaxID=2004952 RepID=A0A2C5Z8W1_9HYPO|nr:hypothetical protein CDD80_2024 [Ophiocordyceps camponoti-rufipedis]
MLPEWTEYQHGQMEGEALENGGEVSRRGYEIQWVPRSRFARVCWGNLPIHRTKCLSTPSLDHTISQAIRHPFHLAIASSSPKSRHQAPPRPLIKFVPYQVQVVSTPRLPLPEERGLLASSRNPDIAGHLSNLQGVYQMLEKRHGLAKNRFVMPSAPSKAVSLWTGQDFLKSRQIASGHAVENTGGLALHVHEI